MNLILIDEEELDVRSEIVLKGRRAEHIRSVLQGRAGQSLRVGKVNGPLGTGMIKRVNEQEVVLRCVFGTDIPEVARVDVLLAMPRPKVLKRLWAPLASMGVGRIIITNAQKVERFYFDSHVLEDSFHQPLLREGLEQAMDTRIPEVQIRRQLKPLVEDELATWMPDSFRLVSDPSATARVAETVPLNVEQRILLAIGPEGGWSAYELDLFQAHGFHPVGMGPRTLRTDTACIAMLALIGDARNRLPTSDLPGSASIRLGHMDPTRGEENRPAADPMAMREV